MPGKSKIIPEVSLKKEINPSGDFPSPAGEDWKREAEKNLKGTDFEQKFISHTYEQFDLRPIYHSGDIQNLGFISGFPGFDNYLRGSEALGFLVSPWKISQAISTDLPAAFNRMLHHGLWRGQNAINLVLDRATRMGWDSDTVNLSSPSEKGVMISHLDDLASALDRVDFKKYPLFVQAGYSAVSMTMMLSALLKKTAVNFLDVKGHLEADPLGMLVLEGTLPVSFASCMDQMAWCIRWTGEYLPGISTVGIDVSHYQDAGGNAVMELAFALATAVEYINQLQDRGLGINLILPQIGFTFGTGPFFYLEIAKFRAARMLWKNVAAEFGGDEVLGKMRVHARTALHNQTLDDPYVNILRVTTEALSAVIGGVDSLHTDILGEFTGQAEEFRKRIARNIQLILLHEAHLREPVDPAGGSFFVESLSAELAQKAWKLFQDIECRGGMLQALQEGFPQSQISRLRVRKDDDISRRRKILVGTTMYTAGDSFESRASSDVSAGILSERSSRLNAFRQVRKKRKLESSLKKLVRSLETDKSEIIPCGIEAFLCRATIGEVTSILNSGLVESVAVEKIGVFRPARKFEQLKSAIKKLRCGGLYPKMLLIPIGNTPQVRNKVEFSKGFFGVAGLEMVDPGRFRDIKEAIAAIQQSDSQAVVICSDDESYPEIVTAMTNEIKEMKPELLVFQAGDPGVLDEGLPEGGMGEYIYPGVDMYLVLKKLVDHLVVNRS